MDDVDKGGMRDGKVTVNLNEEATVTLTPLGLQVLLASDAYVRPGTKAGEPFREQLWELMRVFGPHMHNGADTLFERNAVTFDRWEGREEVRPFTDSTGAQLEAVSEVVDGSMRLREVRYAQPKVKA